MSDDAGVLGTDAGLIRRDDRQWVRVAGADRADYLHRMLTQDVLGIAPAHARAACLLTPTGRIVGDLLIWNAADVYWLDVPRNAPEVLATLEKYVILEDTTFAPADDVRLDLVGPHASEVLAGAGLPVPAPGACREGALGAGSATVLHVDLGRRPRFILKLPADTASDAAAALGVVELGLGAYHVARVEEGEPDFGSELNDGVLFNEAGLQQSVSWSKGCFPGQEPVVMALDRGHPPRALCVLASEGPDVPTTGTPLTHEGQTVGSVTSSAASPTAGGVRALAYVRDAAAHVGTDLLTDDGTSVRVVRVRRLTR